MGATPLDLYATQSHNIGMSMSKIVRLSHLPKGVIEFSLIVFDEEGCECEIGRLWGTGYAWVGDGDTGRHLQISLDSARIAVISDMTSIE